MQKATFNEFHNIGLHNKDAVKLVVFITSSNGDGYSPDNGVLF